MKLTSAALALLSTVLPKATLSQECLLGSFVLEFDGTCTAASVLEAYEDQVYDMAGSTSSTCATSAADDLGAKLAAAGLADASALCDQVYATQDSVPFTKAANRGDDLNFESFFFNGLTDWQDEVETIYEDENYARKSILKEDAEAVRTFYRGTAQGRRVDWPGSLPNFQSSVTDSDGLATCTTNAAMCCWPKDRQANDNNGNCATPYDENCVDKDPADNTNLCFVDLERGNVSTGDDGQGFLGYPEDNNNGEGAIHCHGLAWKNDVNDHTARYKANNLFFVSMYDHMYQRGYVKNIPGAPMCGCVEQMPTVSRSDCTQVDLVEKVKITFDSTTSTFDSELTYVDVNFNACRGINNRNNDLWAYMARLYYEDGITREQFGEAGRIITDTGCQEATRYHLNEKGFTRGYDHDISTWTKVAGRDDMSDGHPYGLEAFNTVFFENSLTGANPILLRICPQCTDTHKKIYYRRITPLTNPNFDLLNHILYHRGNDGGGENRWTEDFTLHSTYEDAVRGENAWLCNNGYNYWAPFDGECSPSGARTTNQYSIFSWFPGPQPDVAYYVNTPEGTGLSEFDSTGSGLLASDFTSLSLGAPSITGRVFERTSDDAIIMSGAGWDIWNRADMGHFLSQPYSGDIDVSVHISSFTGIVNTWAKAGIMLRADNDADSPHVFGAISGNYGSFLSQRRTKGGDSYRIGNWYQQNPIQNSEWIRLVKKMETVELYFKDAAGDWFLHASTEAFFPDDTFRVGLAVTSHDDRYVSSATFEDYAIAEYVFPTSAPSISAAPTEWNPFVCIEARCGTYSQNNGISYYRGYGEGIWGSSDSFYYHNTQKLLSDGAFDVVAYTNRFHTGYKNARGGIMIRDSNDPDAANAFIGMSGYYNGATFQTRASTGASTVHHQTNFVHHHMAWIRLSKPADSGVITASYKINEADEWIELGQSEVNFTGHSLQVGVAVSPGDPNGAVDLQIIGYEVTDARRMLRV